MTSSLGLTAFMATSYLDIKANKLNNTLRRALKLIGWMTKSSDTAAEKVPSLKKKVVPREIPKKLTATGETETYNSVRRTK